MKIRLDGCMSFTVSGQKYVKGKVYDVEKDDCEKLNATGLFSITSIEEKKKEPQGVISMGPDGKSIINKDITEFKCPYCERVFKTEQSLKIHVGRTHKDVAPANLLTEEQKASETAKNPGEKAKE